MLHNPLLSILPAGYGARVYWLRRPPYLRWVAAALLVGTAAWLDLRPDPTELRPFAAVDLQAGVTIEPSEIAWRRVPRGILPPLHDPAGVVVRPVAAGEPLLPSSLALDRVPAPEGWWTMEVRLPQGAVPGQPVQLIVLPTDPAGVPQAVTGLVIVPAPADQDPLAIEEAPGLIAVPGEAATFTAAAIADQRVTAILGTD